MAAEECDRDRRSRYDRCRPAGPVIEQGDLPEVGTRSECRYDLIFVTDLDLTLEHDQKLVAGLSLFGEHLAFRLPNPHGDSGDVGEVRLREVFEQRDLPELLLERFTMTPHWFSRVRTRASGAGSCIGGRPVDADRGWVQGGGAGPAGARSTPFVSPALLRTTRLA